MALLALWNPNIQFFKTDGTINAGGKLVVTDHNDAESIPANYSDADGTTLNSSPIVLDALGRATCYIDDGSTYDLYVKDANGATLWTVSKMTPGAGTIIVSDGFSVSSNDSSVAVVISVDQDGVTNYDLSIQKEIDRAKEAEKGLAGSIDAEKHRAESAESALSKSIADETKRATEAEKGLSDAIEAEKNRAESAESALSKSIADENKRATEAEKGLAGSIEAEKKRAEGVESTLSESIANETKRATEAEKGLADAINALDVTEVGGDGKYIKSISEEDGKIIPVAETMDTAPTRGSRKAVTSDGIQSALDEKLDIDDISSLSFTATYSEDNHRLTFNDIIFDNIYPVVGKYGLATFPETTSTDATEFSGDRDWLLDWRPYLVDMSPVAGETAKAPVAELRKDNWLRTKDGDYAPVCGITSAQSTALDGKKDTLYWKSGSTGDKVSATIPEAFDASGKFVPAKFWEFVKANISTVNTKAGVTYSSPIAVKVYVGTQAYEFGAYTNYHIPAPWETTETKYSVFIGRPSDVYVVDGYSATTGEHMRGLTAKPLPVGTNKFDPEDYRLKRTGISPGPSTVVASKIRNFFYNYVVAASSGCTVNGKAGRTSIFYNNGTYPATYGPTQYRCADWSRACNSGGSSGNAVPVGEMGYHALNAFLCSVEAAYGTRNLWEYNRFSEGICSNYGADATRGGVYLDGTWKNWNTKEATLSSTSENYSVAVNSQYAKFQCMEPQIAASLATEMGVSAGSSFHWNGGDWHFEVPSNLGTVMTLGHGAMNCRMYKLTDSKTVNGHTVRCNLVCALAEGVNPVGDIWCYYGGGAELVYLTDGIGNQNYKASFYLEPDQSRWLATSTTEKITSGTFAFESAYMKLLDSSTAGGLGNTYCLARTGYTPVRRISGGEYNSGECAYQYRQIDDDAKGSAGIRSRRRLFFRGGAENADCSPRCLNARYRPSSSYVGIGCSAQVLLA